jgi:spore photoproduct lyase
VRLGTGEFTDSLALDHITKFSRSIVRFFRDRPRDIFEFKTKSDNIENLLSVNPSRNVVVAWSLSPQRFVDAYEFYTPSIARRLSAARKCADAGYRVAFHFDPIICSDGWREEYRNLVARLFDRIPGRSICWISLGTLRFSRPLKKIIENRFPKSDILNGELLPGFDKKMRYSRDVRLAVYKDMIRWIRRRNKRVTIYLCMEQRALWNACGLSLNRGWL